MSLFLLTPHLLPHNWTFSDDNHQALCVSHSTTNMPASQPLISVLAQRHGAALEVITSRMRLIASQVETPIRIVGLCTSLANAKDLGEWIGATSHSLFNFPPGAPCFTSLSERVMQDRYRTHLCICSSVTSQNPAYPAMLPRMYCTPRSHLYLSGWMAQRLTLHSLPTRQQSSCSFSILRLAGVRPVPLDIHIMGFDIVNFDARLQAMSKPMYNALVAASNQVEF